jgi:hypothetical protein
MTRPRESEAGWQGALEDALAPLGWECFHVTIPIRSRGGWVDEVLWHPRLGIVVFVELKTDPGRVRPDQALMLDSLDRVQTCLGAAVWRPAMWPAIEAFLRDPIGVGCVPGAWSRGPPR